MAVDDVSIANLALARIGITMKIDSLSPPARTKEAIELIAVFDEVRERVLAAAPWPFARKIVTLQQSGSTPFKWPYRYEYPNDCVAIRALYPPYQSGMTADTFREWTITNKVPFELALDDTDALTICTGQDQAVIEYTKLVTNPRLYNSKFRSAFAWALSAEVALPLAKTIDHSRNAAAAYEKEIAEATAQALNEEQADVQPESEFVRARM
jgi:hypothetical protein